MLLCLEQSPKFKLALENQNQAQKSIFEKYPIDNCQPNQNLNFCGEKQVERGSRRPTGIVIWRLERVDFCVLSVEVWALIRVYKIKECSYL